MDYNNDNDYQSKNLHLAGEDSSKVSSVLRPFALPRFEFDDNLQGHLRFDSLVENEVFLGIPCQEDNQWIEDFPRGSSGIEFSSSAAESCSIPGRNNVWSEATSSESVEMLLKSVGQEHNLPEQTIILESDGGNKLGNIDYNMEPSLKVDGEMDYVEDPTIGVDTDQFLDKFPRSSEIVEGEIDHSKSTLQVAGTCENVANRVSAETTTEKSSQIEMRNNEVNASHSDTFVDQNKGDPCISEIQAQNVECPSYNDTTFPGNPNNHDKIDDIHQGASGMRDDVGKSGEDSTIVNKDIDMDDKSSGAAFESDNVGMMDPLSNVEDSSTSKAEDVNDDVLGNTFPNVDEPSTLLGNEGTDLLTAEVCKKIAPSTEPPQVDNSHIIVSSQAIESKYQPGGDTIQPEKQSVVSKSICASDDQGSNLGQSSCTEQEINTVQCSSLPSKPVDECSDNTRDASVPAEVHEETPVGGDLEGEKDASKTCEVDLGDGNHVSSHGQDVPEKICREDLSSKQPATDHSSDQDVPSNERGETMSSVVEECKQDVKNAHGPEIGTSIVNKQDTNPEAEDANCSSHDIVDSVSLSERSDAPAVEVKHCEEMPSIPSSVKDGSMPSSTKEEMDNRCPAEANPTTIVSSPQMASQILPASDVEKDTYGSTPSTADHSSLIIEAADTGSQKDQASVAGEVHQDCPTIREAEGCQQSIVAEERAHDEKETLGRHKETYTEVKQSSKAVEVEKSKEQDASNSSPAVVTAGTQLLETGGKKQEDAVKSVPPPKDPVDICGNLQMVKKNSGLRSSKKETSKDLQSNTSSKNSEVPMDISKPIDKATPSSVAKGGSEQKSRRRSSKSVRESSKKGNQVKGTPVKLSERLDNPSVHLGPSGAGQLVQFDIGSVQRSSAKTSNVVSNSSSNILDLNSSTPPSASFHQPFTDLQQLQLRAQIYVYGSLIQGAAPDEACMVSAFGTSDVGRSVWEPAWRSCIERIHGQKSLVVSNEVPGQSGSGAKTPDQANKQDLNQSKAISSSAARSTSKGTSIPAISPMIPLSSPLWNVATPSGDGLQHNSIAKGAVVGYQAVSSLHPYQTPPMRSFIGQTTTWSSQTPLTTPWVSSPQTSAFDISTRVPVFPITEPVNLTPVKGSSGLVSTGTKYTPPSSVAPGSLPGVIAETSLIDGGKRAASPSLTAEPKSRKRKKVSSTEFPRQTSLPSTPVAPVSAPRNTSHLSKMVPSPGDIGQISLVARSQTETVPAPIVSNHFSTSVAVIAPSFVPKSNPNIVASPLSVDHSKREDANLEKRNPVPLNVNKIEEAKLQAEEAAEHAAAAIGHCQGIWSQLDKQKSTGLTDVESKLASAAATIAAAASVAKAAAAAAKIASNAALQARHMADEALASSTKTAESRAGSLPDMVRNLGNASPASILKGGDGPNCSGSIISAAKEAANRKIEAASVASRHAENLAAIVKAAELAAEAVSHAGKVVAMGDPLTLSELVEAGPDGYWKASQTHHEQGVKSNDATVGGSVFNSVGEASDVHLEKSEGRSKKASHALTTVLSPVPEGIPTNTVEGSVRVEECAEKDMRGGKGLNTSELTKTPDISTKPEMNSRSINILEADGNNTSSIKENDIKEGCLVEVFRDIGDFNDAWFLGNVSSVKDGSALVCYTKLKSDKGQVKEEWIPLEVDGDEVPRIRAAHPTSHILHSEGARKRRRAAVKEYSWSVGDQVDAWIDDCWREGVIIEKNKKDETTLTVNFPARGDNAVVRVWHLRPRLIWKDGEWIEWVTSKEQSSLQGDTPNEKRMKLGNPATEVKEKAVNIEMPVSGTTKETKLLPLSADEQIFNVGSNRDENKPLRTMRSGLQKEGPKVVFGVPKPGKKRKFMEVSKHYDADKGIKTSSGNDTSKFSKYLMPTGSGVGGWKYSTRTDPKEKVIAETKLRPPKPRKPPTSSKISKDSFSKSTPTTSGDDTSTDHVAKDNISYDNIESGHLDSVAEEVAKDSMHFSSEALPVEPAKRPSKSRSKPEQLNKGNRAAPSVKSIKDEMNDKANSESNEPRRSNRRIQPTSRLLEGLQSSLIISKLPSVSHDKGHRTHSRGTSKGNNHD